MGWCFAQFVADLLHQLGFCKLFLNSVYYYSKILVSYLGSLEFLQTIELLMSLVFVCLCVYVCMYVVIWEHLLKIF
jgi:hypothetical protein